MRTIGFLALLALAAPVGASTGESVAAQRSATPVDLLYPEIQVNEEGWRSLLPVILLNTEDLAEAPVPVLSPDPDAEQHQ